MSILSASSANVSVFALWGLLLTFTLVIQSTCLFELPWLISTPLGASCTLLGMVSAGFPTDLAVQVADFEEPEFGKFVKGNIIDWTWPFSDGFVQVEDPVVNHCVNGWEVHGDVLSIPYKLVFVMGEDKPHGSLEHIEGGEPLSVVPDGLGGLNMPKSELKVSNHLQCSVIRHSWMDPWEDDIQINCLPLQDFDPLWVQEFRKSSCTEKVVFGDFDVTGVIFDEFSHELLAWCELEHLCIFVSSPCEQCFVHSSSSHGHLRAPPPSSVTSGDSDLLPYSGWFGQSVPSCSSAFNFHWLVPPHWAASTWEEWVWSSIAMKLVMAVSTCSRVTSLCTLDSPNALVISCVASVHVMFPCAYSLMRSIQSWVELGNFVSLCDPWLDVVLVVSLLTDIEVRCEQSEKCSENKFNQEAGQYGSCEYM